MPITRYIPLREDKIKIHGRTSQSLPLNLFWTGSGIELETDASELYFELESDFSIYEQWIRIEINGYPSVRTALARGMNMICAFRGMETRSVKNVRLIKEVQPMRADDKAMLRVHSVMTDGKLFTIKPRRYKLEFIGDSITSGEGLGGSAGIQEWVPSVFTTYEHYVPLTAAALNADYRIISQSGWGVYCSWDNNLTHALPAVYNEICSVLEGSSQKECGCCEKNDFSSWQPDAIVVNLGCNDSFSFTSPAWTDPETGKTYKMRLDPDGSFNAEDLQKLSNAIYSFLKTLRRLNPDSYIVWAYGMIGRTLAECIENTVRRYASDCGDDKAVFCLLPDTKPEWMAANNHPGRESHRAAAKVLSMRLEELLLR